jgi:hypothetical protein
MKIEEQVCNLELAKKLKEPGVRQEGYFWWFKGKMPNVGSVGYVLAGEFSASDERIACAFTDTELGEISPGMFHLKMGLAISLTITNGEAAAGQRFLTS